MEKNTVTSEGNALPPKREISLCNFTGTFIPESGILHRLNHFLSRFSGEEIKATTPSFWTPQRRQLAENIIESVNTHLKPFGAPQMEFNPEQVELYPRSNFATYGSNSFTSGYFRINKLYTAGDADFAKVFAGLVLRNLSLRLGKKAAPTEWEQRRYGLEMKARQTDGGHEAHFEFLNNSILEKTRQEILRKEFPSLFPEDSEHPEEELEIFCQVVSITNKEKYPTPEDVFKVCQKAVFGRGRLLELGRLVKITYGKGGLRALDEAYSRKTLDDKRAFIISPVEEEELYAAACDGPREEAYQVGKDEISVDFSKVPPNIPIRDFFRKVKDENGVVKLERGLRRRLVSGINNLSSELEDFSKGYMQFPPFGFESVRVRIKKALKGEGELLVLAVDRPDDIANIDVAAKNVMFDSLGKEDKPAATLDERYLLMNFYRVRNLPNAPVSVYCLEAKDKKSGATVYALDFAPRDADPQEWWKNKKH
ncbi:MAG: hypothetical protein ACD_32C00003G0005 [uncultured bacterium]|uniref:Uncharacterized protein n=1 Tax=Candidatus Daviesbacteria bacterium GW2011_GWC2_40_12 TaxID=1618431 RepID=A0A0G0QPA9_9BACT|nr:MAG: hypothetical protein ACD_32C00003G0005 [uncultured bacterium]KKR16184.1 MAG: hypothetical protein UT45_C0008G0059 [Candidatus Daviesbacteria bacterium GW2011_GWA2_39_33]KKR24684.1 MAG: hypothetical protein UT54_C0014G0016 [Candidatus Daviesbacteria bacterium GW2011_GWB1_39_5]KKR31778.1 MAG: hypothetical protein UT65_C0017G0002 [Parcubacteria group bacterium GW2011_GWF2_39_8b]KKR41963.1 MAG: hypothetical protein UT77_C0005G0078 [Candidatus Daviesbacteria bacterium GW2011_GWC2_40_12]OGE2